MTAPAYRLTRLSTMPTITRLELALLSRNHPTVGIVHSHRLRGRVTNLVFCAKCAMRADVMNTIYDPDDPPALRIAINGWAQDACSECECELEKRTQTDVTVPNWYAPGSA